MPTVFNNTYKFDETKYNPNLCKICGGTSFGGLNVRGERYCDIHCYRYAQKHDFDDSLPILNPKIFPHMTTKLELHH